MSREEVCEGRYREGQMKGCGPRDSHRRWVFPPWQSPHSQHHEDHQPRETGCAKEREIDDQAPELQ